MIQKSKIIEIVDQYLGDSPLFLVDVKVSGTNHISVFIDGDDGVPISSCIELSRHIESSFDRDEEDFELEVSSVGVSRPLSMPRQFKKNVGREIAFVNQEGKKEIATLIAADDEAFTVEKSVTKKKKKKDTPPEDPVIKLPYDAVKEVKVQVSFKSKKEDQNK